MIYWHKNPFWLQWLMPNFLWKIPSKDKTLYLTFDDGPIPELTDWVLAELAKYDAKATFFVVGNNVQKNPEIFRRVLAAGHQVGNHTFHHVSGWKTDIDIYINEVALCQKAMQDAGFVAEDSGKKLLFRPPYVRCKKAQKRILDSKYTFVMWDVIAGDFDQSLDPEKCFVKTRDAISKGSIIILHDSIKAEVRVRYVLPRLLAHFHGLGWTFKALPLQ
jgi:peptidoglycan-N-acetylglucosamine deacetylase